MKNKNIELINGTTFCGKCSKIMLGNICLRCTLDDVSLFIVRGDYDETTN